MDLLDVLTGPWAIQPDKLLEIQAIYAAHARGERADLPAIAARLGRPLDNSQNNRGYQMAGDVAVVPLSGVLAKKMNLFADISGGTSTEVIGAAVRAAAADPKARAIVLAVDSPGGTVDGTQALAATVRAAAGAKPPSPGWTGRPPPPPIGSPPPPMPSMPAPPPTCSAPSAWSPPTRTSPPPKPKWASRPPRSSPANTSAQPASTPHSPPTAQPASRPRSTNSTPSSSPTWPATAASPPSKSSPTWPTAAPSWPPRPSTAGWPMASCLWIASSPACLPASCPTNAVVWASRPSQPQPKPPRPRRPFPPKETAPWTWPP